MSRLGLWRLAAPLVIVAMYFGGLAAQSTPAAPTLAEQTEFGIGYYKVGKYDLAKETLEGVLRSDSGNFRALYGMGLVAYQDKHLAEAERYLKEALAVKQDPEAYLTLGAVYRSGHALDAAEKVFRDLRRQDPKNGKAAYNLGMLVLSQNRYSEARDLLISYLELEPKAKDKFRVLKKLHQIDLRLQEAKIKK